MQSDLLFNAKWVFYDASMRKAFNVANGFTLCILLWGCKLNANDKIVLFLFSHSNQSFIPFQHGMAWHSIGPGYTTNQFCTSIQLNGAV